MNSPTPVKKWYSGIGFNISVEKVINKVSKLIKTIKQKLL